MKFSKKNSFKFYGNDIPILSKTLLTAVVVICCLMAFGLSTLKPVSATPTLTPTLTACSHAPAGVVACYKAENNTLDSASINHGTPVGDLTYGPGRAGQAFQFSGPVMNGVTGVTVPDANSLDFTNALTIEGWVNPRTTASPNAGIILSKGRLDACCGQPYTIYYQNQLIGFRVGNQFGFDDLLSTPIPLNSYTHFAATYDGTMMKLYINGVFVNFKNTTIGTLVNSSFNLFLGYSDFIALPFAGAVDELALYNRPLSAAEITTIVNSTQPPPPPPPTPAACAAPPSGLVSWYRAEWDTGDTLGGNNATAQGNVTIAPGKVGQAFQVAGGAYLSVPDSPSLDFTNALTIEGWINPTTINPTAGTVMVKGRLDTCCGQPYSILYTNQLLNFRVGNNLGIDGVVSNPLPLNSYTHFAATYDGTLMKLYINGVLAASKSTTIGTLINEDLGLKIGSEAGFAFAGAIDELSLYNRPLSTLEIAAIFNKQAGGKCLTTPCQAITVNPSNPTLPTGQAGTQYNQTFTPTGGNGTTTFALSDGPLPNGLTLSTGGVLSGTPTSFGNFNFTVNVTDASGCLGARTYALTINPPCSTITVNPATLPNGFQATAYSQTLTATGGTAPYTFAVTTGSLPGGLNLASGGALTGTPLAAGTFNFAVTATDSNGCTGGRAYTVIVSGNGLLFYPLAAPVRLLDTRPGQSACNQPNTPIAGGTSLTQPARNLCTIPANAQALTGHVTTVQSGGGFLALYPSNAQQPTVASTNYGPNEIINNVFTVGLGTDGAFKIFAINTTDVVVDVTGYYAPPSPNGLYFHPLPAPVRLLETRPGQTGCVTPGAPLAGNADSMFQAISACTGIPAAARAIVGNATTVGPQGPGYLALFPADATRPLVASSNYNLGQIVNGPFTTGLAPTGEFKIFTAATTDLVVDVLGYYSPEASDALGAGLLFTPLAHPVRLLETRPGQPIGCFKPGAPLSGGTETTQTARGICDGVTIPANALGVVGNATVVTPSGAGFLTLWPSTASRPLVAISNYNPGDVGNRHFIVGLGNTDGAFKLFTQATTNLVIDLSGYFAP